MMMNQTNIMITKLVIKELIAKDRIKEDDTVLALRMELHRQEMEMI